MLLVVVRGFGVELGTTRVPEASDKAKLLRAITVASRYAALHRLLGLIDLSPSRYHAWKRKKLVCELDDHSSCPRSRPMQLTANEVQAIKEYVLDPKLRHMTVRALSLHAQRLGKVFASGSTWRRLIRTRAWRRPRLRVYPAKPKTGVRATRPNEWWHIDLTVIRLTSGAKVYLHAVIDNFSRKILAWELAECVAGETTTKVIKAAAKFLGRTEVSLMADSGSENVNEVVDGYLESSVIKRVLALVEVVESNSMIEGFWRSLRHQWLYLHELDTMESLSPLVEFYVKQHNAVMPHTAFNGATPDEVFFGVTADVEELPARRQEARQRRVEVNRSKTCGARTENDLSSDSEGVALAVA